LTDRATELSDELYERILNVVAPGDSISTLARGERNHVVAIARSGLRVDTAKSRRDGTEPIVPAWMVQVAWERLQQRGVLTNVELLNDLNVKRSAFVCALLARFPDVRVVSSSPIILEFAR
jgi:hypothetical protein